MRRRFMNESKIAFDYNDYMTIEALEDNVEISLTRVSEYGINGIGWTKYNNKIVVNSGDFVSIKNTLNKGETYGVISINGKCNLRGNCNSLIFGDYASSHNDLSEYGNCFHWLLNDNSGIQEVDSNFLPATTLADYCYSNMFYNCTSLTTAPALPATTLADYCYSNMFYNCTSLTTAPALPATTLAKSCYASMFLFCNSLTTAPELPATTLALDCYNNMFYGTNVLPDCSNINFSSSAIISSGGLRGLFAGTKVTDADLFVILPINPSTGKYWLPATTLSDYCYYYMFNDCTGLTTAPELPATILALDCYNKMFYGCTGLTTVPELPATTLVRGCYNKMFYGCTKLNYIKMLATDISANDCLTNWVYGVSSTGTFVKNPAMTSLPTGQSGIPSGWRVQNA